MHHFKTEGANMMLIHNSANLEIKNKEGYTFIDIIDYDIRREILEFI